MNTPLLDYYKLPKAIIPSRENDGAPSTLSLDILSSLWPKDANPLLNRILPRILVSGHPDPQVNVATLVNTLRLEHYARMDSPTVRPLHPQTRAVYYLLRPLLPVLVRKHLQRLALRGWQNAPFPQWPLDLTVERVLEAALVGLLQAREIPDIPFIWFWPNGCRACAIMTHDVETKRGRNFCTTLMNMESEYGIHSSFEIVPESRYHVPPAFLAEIRTRGCEVCLHGLNHDGRLFENHAQFRLRADKINHYAEQFGAIGFRSPILYRNLEWLSLLNISYDMSVPNLGHLDPQKGGCCTVMPYYIGDILELPLTTVQDYHLYHVIGEWTIALWQEQTRRILERNGLMSFVVHPDYTTRPRTKGIYTALLDWLARLRQDAAVWTALPGEVYRWWNQRNHMQLVHTGDGWQVTGDGCERATVARLTLDGQRLVYSLP